MNIENVKEKLKIKLKEIFQIEDLDLDFGIYRIMKCKKDEIEKFIEKDLIEEVTKQLNLLSEEERKSKEKELEELKKKIIELEEDYQSNKKYQQKLKEIEQIKVSEDLERDIYNYIYNFFSRYYDKGDFITQRRYGKDDKYCIPYNGEEVKLYWANYDQYYVKTTEFFRKYSFKVNELKVNFRVVEAEEEKSNIKSQEKKYFLFSSKKQVELNKDVLDIYFEYRGLNEKEENKYGSRNVQEVINEEISREITKFVEKQKHKKNQNLLLLIQKEEENSRSILEKKLWHYTRRNTSDYFIHKDLQGFLERELDFYIKSEVINLEDVHKLSPGELLNYSLKIKVIKNIANKIIEFVSQIENFQKKLWEKKKFVLKTEYVITTDRIPEEFYEEILKNKEQLKEWEQLGFDYSPFIKGWQTKSDRVFSLSYNPALKEKARELRKAGNLSEVLLWNEIKNKKMLGFDFTRQQTIGNYIVDFYCHKLNLVIEIDGESHEFKGNYDEQRDNYLKSLGLTILHFNDLDIKKSLSDVLIQIENWIKENTPSANADTPFKKRGIKLPIDTKNFSQDFKMRLLEKLTEKGNLDDLIDGILIKSENWQTLNLLLGKYKEKVQTIYIDPPFNKEQDADYLYNVKYKDSTWISILENRLWLAKNILNDSGSIFVRCDYNGNMYVRLLMNVIFKEENFRNELIISRTRAKQQVENQFVQQTESLFFYSRGESLLLKEVERSRNPEWHSLLHFPRADETPRIILNREFYPPKGRRWALSQ